MASELLLSLGPPDEAAVTLDRPGLAVVFRRRIDVPNDVGRYVLKNIGREQPFAVLVEMLFFAAGSGNELNSGSREETGSAEAA